MSTESKHTPGPWSYAPAVPRAQRCFYIAGNQDANNREVDIGMVQGGYYSCEANARLIAAAPTIFDALREIEDTLRNAGSDADLDALASLARAAISKATGADK